MRHDPSTTGRQQRGPAVGMTVLWREIEPTFAQSKGAKDGAVHDEFR
jgi:hypothetical protein